MQQHHTYAPSYAHFKKTNHFEMQQGMKGHHVNANGWSDIGQHFTTFPDGSIMSGRSLELSPACIYGNNANSICFEHVGNFDLNGDEMTAAHRKTIIAVTAMVCRRFNIPINTVGIVYHHWFNLSSGVRNDGRGGNKSCPGTGFFGGNKVPDCEANFLPLVKTALKKLDKGADTKPESAGPIKYVCVVTDSLSVRQGPAKSKALVPDRGAATAGSILRVYEEKGGWLRISDSQQHWVAGELTREVRRATVTASTLNVRSGPDASFPKVGGFTTGQEVFIVTEQDGWCKVSMEDKWVKGEFLA
jgi:SH3-like domain-containing protein